MAQLTPNEILEISEPIEAIYQRTVDDLLINIARHFGISGWERTRYWEIKKLSEMGALTKESAAIIAKNTQMLPEEIEKAFLQVSEKACLDIDPQLRKAASKGVLQDPQNTPSTSLLMRRDVQSFVDQAVDKLNMTNTTMLASTQQAYLKGITSVVNDVQLAEAKLALEAGALAVTTGVETRTMAIRKAMNQLAATGITGFYDSAGRKWSADAYAAMVVRTTAHNAAISAIRTRQKEFGGGDIFQVSSHPGARPLCYPYQGKFFSWSGEGIFTDGAGHQHEYKNIDESSYGEPAGLFGINCGHHPIPMIEGFSYPQDGPEQSAEENRKEYEESQKQRAYEREIRDAKRDLEIAKATGDTEAIKAAEQKVAQKQANMRAYTKETGRPRRYDREQIAGSKIPEGYKGWRAEQNSDLPLSGATKAAKAEKAFKSNYTAAATIEEAETKAKYFTDTSQWAATGVSYAGIDVEVANIINKTITDFYDIYDVDKFGGIIAPKGNSKEGKLIDGATAAYSPVRNSFLLNRKSLKDAKTAAKSLEGEASFVTDFLAHPEKYDRSKMNARVLATLDNSKESGRGLVPTTIEDVINHELGHKMEKVIRDVDNIAELQSRMSQYAPKISGYACDSWGEYVAESFASYRKGENIADPKLIEAFKAKERKNGG